MSGFIAEAVEVAKHLSDSDRRIRAELRQLREELAAQKVAIQEVRFLLGSPQHIPYAGSEVVLLRLQQEVSDNRWTAFRLRRKSDGTVWELDDDDTLEYRVMPVPGCFGMFPGCRCLCVLHHIEQYTVLVDEVEVTKERGVYLPIAGECFGFLALITGSDLVDDESDEADRQYTWEQLGVDAGDQYDETSDPVGAGAFGLAIHEQQEWMGLEDGVQIDRRSLNGQEVFMWYSVAHDCMKFSSPPERMAVACEEA